MRYIVINKRLPSRYLTAVPASRSLPYGSISRSIPFPLRFSPYPLCYHTLTNDALPSTCRSLMVPISLTRSLPYGSHTLPTLPLRLPHAYHRIAMMRLTTE